MHRVRRLQYLEQSGTGRGNCDSRETIAKQRTRFPVSKRAKTVRKRSLRSGVTIPCEISAAGSNHSSRMGGNPIRVEAILPAQLRCINFRETPFT